MSMEEDVAEILIKLTDLETQVDKIEEMVAAKAAPNMSPEEVINMLPAEMQAAFGPMFKNIIKKGANHGG